MTGVSLFPITGRCLTNAGRSSKKSVVNKKQERVGKVFTCLRPDGTATFTYLATATTQDKIRLHLKVIPFHLCVSLLACLKYGFFQILVEEAEIKCA